MVLFVLDYEGSFEPEIREAYEQEGCYCLPMVTDQMGSDGNEYPKPIFGFEGIRTFDPKKEEAILIGDTNVTQMNKVLHEVYPDADNIPTLAKKGQDSHGTHLLRVKSGHFLWDLVKQFNLSTFKEDGRLAYNPGEAKSWSPLICKGRVTVELLGKVKGKAGRPDSYSVKLRASKGAWAIENIAATEVEEWQEDNPHQRRMDRVEALAKAAV